MRAKPPSPDHGTRRRSVRRTTVAEQRVIWAVAGVAAVVGAFSPAAPTALPVADALLRAGFAALVTIAASRSRRWAWMVMAGLTVLGAEGVWLAVAALGLGLAVVAAMLDRRRVYGAVVGAVVVQALLRMAPLGFELASTLLVAVAITPVMVSAYLVSPRRVRRRVHWGIGIAIAALALGGVCFGVAAALAYKNVNRGAEFAQQGLDAARDGRTGRATELLRSSSDSFRAANATLDAWWAKPALAVPVVAQNAQAVSTLSREGQRVTDVAAVSAGLADYEHLRYEDGRIDLNQIRTLADPLAATAQAVQSASVATGQVQSPWLVDPIASGVKTFQSQLNKVRPEAETAAAGARVVPGMLGGNGTRRYFVAFTTPAESRGLGGFMGDWAEITATDGKLEMTRHGRVKELNDVPGGALRTISGPPDYVSRYARYKPGQYFQDVTFSPDMPAVAQVVGELYPQMGGEKIDGVLVVDPYALAALLRFTGPIKIDGLKDPLTADNAADILVRRQYVEFTDRDTRQDFLDEASRVTFDTLVKGDIPGPRKVADTLYPMVTERHLMFTSLVNQDEQDLMGRLKATGAFPRKSDHDFFALTTSNGGNNKIDVFLKRTVDYRATFNPETGAVESKVKIELANEAPAEGLPESVIGSNDRDKGANPVPLGTNQLYFSFYTPLGLRGATIDGKASPLEYQTENGFPVYSHYLAIPPGGKVVVELNLFGEMPDRDRYGLEIVTQPMVNPDKVSTSMQVAPGWQIRGERRTGKEGFGVNVRGDEAVLATTTRESIFSQIDIRQR